ncbi:hypothetical protein AB3S75_036738 [Citrus x aurantiifolia]
MQKVYVTMKNKACVSLFLAFLVVSSCSFAAAITIQAAESVDFKLETGKSRMSSASRYILATWVNKIKSRRLAKVAVHKVPSGPNPIGNWHHSLKP